MSDSAWVARDYGVAGRGSILKLHKVREEEVFRTLKPYRLFLAPTSMILSGVLLLMACRNYGTYSLEALYGIILLLVSSAISCVWMIAYSERIRNE